MVNQHNGQWLPDEDYSKVNEKDMCDYDYVARYVKEQNYFPKTTMKNLADHLIDGFVAEDGYEPKYLKNYMINVEMLSAFVYDGGGIAEFDYFD
ncbi:MAG: hypothetical protein EOM59_13360 [Clostridia bacterium]|nr:hypothetical protein [Clostridia bacterium]